LIEDVGAGGEPLPPRDPVGCLYFAARVGCGMAILQILMALAIILVALISLFFFR
jgi:hypothetical protein